MPAQRILFLSFPVALLLAGAAVGADLPQRPLPGEPEPACRGAPDCCARCRCCAPCQQKVCRVACEMKTITKHCWRVECEEFCAPLPGCVRLSWDWCGLFAGRAKRCEADCCDDACGGDACGTCCGKAPGCVPPKCGPVRIRKKLVLEEYECQVPVYSCEVRYLCSGCADCADCLDVDPEAK